MAGHAVVIGNGAMLVSRGVVMPADHGTLTRPDRSNVLVAIDGALVGGASLKPDEMAGIVGRAGIMARARGFAG